MEDVHFTECISRDDDGVVLRCPTCERTISVGRDHLEVLVVGDPSARHLGGIGDVVVAAQVNAG